MTELELRQPKVKESELQAACLQWLKVRGVLHWRMSLGPILHQRAGNAFWRKNPLKGFPDIAGVLKRQHPGVMFAIELKARGGRISPEQQAWIDMLNKAGAKAAVVRSMSELYEVMKLWGEV